MSACVMRWVFTHSTQAGTPLLVLLAVADVAHDSGLAVPSVRKLARKARISPRQVQHILRDLVASGELEIHLGGGRRAAAARCRRCRAPREEAARPLDPPAPQEPHGTNRWNPERTRTMTTTCGVSTRQDRCSEEAVMGDFLAGLTHSLTEPQLAARRAIQQGVALLPCLRKGCDYRRSREPVTRLKSRAMRRAVRTTTRLYCGGTPRSSSHKGFSKR